MTAPARRVAAVAAGARHDAIDAAARMLAAAENPLIITASAGRDPAAVAALADFAQRFAMPVVEHRQRHLSLPADHPCHLGYDPSALLDDADAILVLECDVPWIPSRKAPPPDCKVIHIGVDPLFSRYPIRGFPADVAITGAPRAVLPRLAAAFAARVSATSIEERRRRVAERREAQQAGWRKAREAVATQQPLSPVWVSACLAAARDPGSVIVNEYTLLPRALPVDAAGQLFRVEPGGGARLGRRRGARASSSPSPTAR